MLEAINDGLRRYSDFKGRSTRIQYNSFLLFYILVDLFVNLINPNLTTLNFIIVVVLFVPLLACQIRRSHDVGKSGWWILIPFYSVYLMFKPTVPPAAEETNSL